MLRLHQIVNPKNHLVPCQWQGSWPLLSFLIYYLSLLADPGLVYSLPVRYYAPDGPFLHALALFLGAQWASNYFNPQLRLIGIAIL